MRISRIFCDAPLDKGDRHRVDKETERYLSQVLRLKDGDKIIVFNGRSDGYYDGQLIQIDRQQIDILVGEYYPTVTASPITIHLGQGISRADRMEYAIQKAVEVGVSSITPIVTEYCDGKNTHISENKLARWEKIIQASGEQCERNVLPILHPAISVEQWFAEKAKDVLGLVCHPGNYPTIKSLSIKDSSAFAIAIGPEGGFSDSEIGYASQRDFSVVALGPRILRNETATVVALTLIQSRWGDF